MKTFKQKGSCQWRKRKKDQRKKADRSFSVRLKATDGDGVRALKSFLKVAWRRHDLRAHSVTEESEVPS
jgi:hypothetical protein